MSIYNSPLSIPITSRKKFILNLNNYRNLHYRLLNKAKILYKDIMKEQILSKGKKYDKIFIMYTIYQPSKRKFDIGNIASIHQKFFEDALVELGGLEDDRYSFIPMCMFCYGGIDATNPRVDIEVIDCDRKFVTKIHRIVDDNLKKLYNVNTK